MKNKPAKVAAPVVEKAAGKDDRHFVTALARGLSVLSCFSSGEKMLVSAQPNHLAEVRFW